MRRNINYSLVGMFVIGLTILSIVLLLWLTSFKHREAYRTYVVYMHEEVSGLSIDAPVRYNGVKVGYVKAIRLNPNDPQQVILTLRIRDRTPISTSTIATLKSEGVTGVDYIGLKALTPQAPLLTAKPAEKYPVIPSEPSLLLKLSTALQEVTKTIKDLGNSVNQVFDEPNRVAIRDSLAHIEKITKTVAQNSKRIDDTMVLMHQFMKNATQASMQLPVMMGQVQTTLNVIQLTAKRLHQVSRDVSVGMQSVSTQIVPQVQQILSRLNDMSGNLQQLSRELVRNPSILVRGQYPAAPGPGERR